MFTYLAILLSIILVLCYGSAAFRKDLRALPGPLLARFSGLYRLSLVCRGDAPQNYRNVHEKYGVIVRVGANHVSVSDPSMIPVIYGIGTKFHKVLSLHLASTSLAQLFCRHISTC